MRIPAPGAPSRRAAGAPIAVPLALAALALGGCGGGSSSSEAATASTAGRYVTAANLGHYKPDSPQETALSWWRAVQFGNAGVARGYYAPAAAPPIADLQHEISAATSQFVGVPHFNSADRHDGRATLYFFLTRPGAETAPRPLSVNLVEADGKWRLADDLLLEQQVARVAKLLRASREDSG